MIEKIPPYEWFLKSRSKVTVPMRGDMPAIKSLSEAYSIQKEVVCGLGWEIGAWKLGGTNLNTRKLFNCDELFYGPVNKTNIYQCKYGNAITFVSDRALMGEIEIAFRFSGPELPVQQLERSEEIFLYCDAFSISIELPQLGSFQHEYSNLEYLVADLCGSGYLLLAPPVDLDQYVFLDDTQFSIIDKDRELAVGSVHTLLEKPLSVLWKFLNLAIKQNLKIEAGQWIATGGCSDCVMLPDNKMLSVKIGTDLAFEFQYVIER